MAETILKATDVVSGYGKLEILHGINVEVKEGELVTIIGPNGSGKSTFVKTIIGLVPCWSGNISIADPKENQNFNVTSLKPYQIVTSGIPLSYVPQVSNVFPTLTVEENLKIGGFVKRKDPSYNFKKKVEEIYDIFPRLKSRTGQSAALLSGGERQMLALGKALMSEPKILLLDEPSAALAPVLADVIFHEIQTLMKLGLSILLVEQRATRALQISDRAYVFVSGEVAHSDKAENILHNPKIGEMFLGKR